jgi:hypothetical protein
MNAATNAKPQQQAANVPAVPSARCFTLRRRRRDVARLRVLQYFTKAKQHVILAADQRDASRYQEP